MFASQRWAIASCNRLAHFSRAGTLLLASVVSGTILSPLTVAVRADDKTTPEVRLIEGIWRGREKLRSGIVRVKYTITRPNQPRARNISLFYAFDYDAGTLRYDMEEGDRKTQLARTPTEALLHIDKSHAISRHKPDWKLTITDAQPYELRTVGLAGIGEFEYCTSFDRYREFISRVNLIESKPLSDDLWRLTWNYDVAQSLDRCRMSITIDESKDYAPVRFELVVQTGSEVNGKLIEKVESVAECAWEKRGDAWVPQRWQLERPAIKTCVLEFAWECVNEPVPYDYFLPEGFDLPKGTIVVDRRFEPAIVEREIGIDPISKP